MHQPTPLGHVRRDRERPSPGLAIDSATSSISPVDRAATATAAPARPTCTIARPTPRPPPVTTAVTPLSRGGRERTSCRWGSFSISRVTTVETMTAPDLDVPSLRRNGSPHVRRPRQIAACESFLAADQLDEVEAFYPLHVRFCADCLLAQLEAYVPGTRSSATTPTSRRTRIPGLRTRSATRRG